MSIPELTQQKQGRAELEGVATRAAVVFRSAEVDFSAIEIKMDDAHLSAKAAATASLRATRRGGEAKRGPRAVNFLLSKEDGKWLITSVTVWPEGDELQ